MTNRAIAEELQVAEDTVKSHMRHVFQKFDVADRAHAVHRAWELGVLPETAVAS
jgi:ATP/maltotriose-dependent transcriptional regulator MalT